MVMSAPVLGLTVDSPPIVLSPNLELDRLDDREIADCLEVGLLPSPPMFRGYAPINELYGVRIRYPLSKSIGVADPSDSPESS